MSKVMGASGSIFTTENGSIFATVDKWLKSYLNNQQIHVAFPTGKIYQEKLYFMKPLFVCGSSRNTSRMIALAQTLKSKNQLEDASAFVCGKDINNQYKKLMTKHSECFSKVFSMNEIFNSISKYAKGQKVLDKELKEIEEQYGGEPLWNDIFAERALVSFPHPKYFPNKYYNRKKILIYFISCIRQFEYILEKTKFDCVIDFTYVDLFRQALDLILRKNGLPYYFPRTGNLFDLRMPGKDRYIIAQRPRDNYNYINERYEQLLRQPESINVGWEYLKYYRKNRQNTIYNVWGGKGKGLGKNNNKNKVLGNATNHANQFIGNYKNFKSGLKKQKAYFKRIYVQFQNEVQLIQQSKKHAEIRYNFYLLKNVLSVDVIRNLQYTFRMLYTKTAVNFYDDDLPSNFVFFGLHVTPEFTTSVLAPYESNQVAVVENIARSLPLHMNLVVKLNPAMRFKDSIESLRYLKKIPNVFLVSHYANTRSLIEKSTAVITITGTIGFESILLRKPVFYLGDHGSPWFLIKDVIKLKDWRALYHELRNIDNFVINDVSLAAFLQSLYENSFPVERGYTWNTQEKIDVNDPSFAHMLDEFAQFLINLHKYSSNTNIHHP